MSKLFITGAIVVLLIVSGIYFTQSNNVDDLNIKKDKLENSLVVAQNKLDKEKDKLNDMTNVLRDSFALAVDVQDQMKKASDMVQQTDFMFIDPEGPNPELKVANPLSRILINDQRKNINFLISEWREKIDILSVRKIDIRESEKIIKDIEVIKKFIQDLSQIVESLTPANSGFSQFQINIYISELPSIEDINEVLDAINTSIENSNNNPPVSPVDNTGINMGTSNNPLLNPDIVGGVTPEDVIAEQEVVEASQTEVTYIQEQLVQVEEQIQQLSPTPPLVSPPDDTSTNLDTVNQNVNEENNTNNPVDEYTSRQITPSQGIIIQPGPPRLIQGTDAY